MADNNDLAAGLYFDLPRDGAPEFVLGQIILRKDQALDWLNAQTPNDKGYIRLDVLKAKATGKPYIKLNTWKPSSDRTDAPNTGRPVASTDDDNGDVPF